MTRSRSRVADHFHKPLPERDCPKGWNKSSLTHGCPDLQAYSGRPGMGNGLIRSVTIQPLSSYCLSDFSWKIRAMLLSSPERTPYGVNSGRVHYGSPNDWPRSSKISIALGRAVITLMAAGKRKSIAPMDSMLKQNIGARMPRRSTNV